jgi:branched-chain amino acid transport system ATP-binding protein
MRTENALQLIDVHKSFGETPIIRGVDLEVIRGERHAIIGPNGAGKSTLFNLITGKFPVSDGVIKLNGADITGLPPYEIFRKGLGRSFQAVNIFNRMSVYENIRCSVLWSLGYKYSFWHGIDRLKDVRECTEMILDQIGMQVRRDVLAGELSYAEQRSLEIGITIAGGSDLIMLDEPTAGMNRSETEQAVELIRNVSEGKTLVVVEHDMSVVFSLADRISVLVYGEVLVTDTPDNVKNNKAVQEAYLGSEQI